MKEQGVIIKPASESKGPHKNNKEDLQDFL